MPSSCGGYVLHYGVPRVIISDRGSDLTTGTDLGKIFLKGVVYLPVPAQAHWKLRIEAHNRVMRRYVPGIGSSRQQDTFDGEG